MGAMVAKSSSMSKLLIATSIGMLVHATLCAIYHRDYLKAVQQPFTYAPVEIAVQCAIALVVGTWGVLRMHANFMPIRTTEVLGKQTMDNLEPGADFMHF